MTDPNVKKTGFNSNTVGEQEITVTYKGKSTTFNVNINENVITSISIHNKPNKLNYFEGENIDLTGGIIKAHYSDGITTKNYSMQNKEVTITGFDSENVGTKTITVEYSEKTATFDVVVNKVDLSTIIIENYPNKLIYNVGEEIDLTEGKILLKYNNGTTKSLSMTDSQITMSGYNKENIGSQIITLTYEEKVVTFEVSVNNKLEPTDTIILNNISIYNNPNKINYHIGEDIDLTGGIIKLIYHITKDTSVETYYKYISMSLNDVNVSGFSSTEEGTKTITVTYLDKETTFNVEVSKEDKNLSRIEVTKLPRKKRYIQYQEELNPADGNLTLVYTDNTSEVMPLSNDDISLLDFDNTKLGEQQVIVIYRGLETTFPVSVYEAENEGEDSFDDGTMTKVEIAHNLEKVNYVKGVETIDISGMILRIYYEDGETRNIDLSEYPNSYTISGFDNTKIGEQTITLNFNNFKLQFKINIVNNDEIFPIPDTLAKVPLFIKVLGIILILIGSKIIFVVRKTEH